MLFVGRDLHDMSATPRQTGRYDELLSVTRTVVRSFPFYGRPTRRCLGYLTPAVEHASLRRVSL